MLELLIELAKRFVDGRDGDGKELVVLVKENYMSFQDAARDFLGLFRSTLEDLR